MYKNKLLALLFLLILSFACQAPENSGLSIETMDWSDNP